MAAKITSYVKNVGKSVVYSSIDILKEDAEGISEFLETSGEIMKEAYASVRKFKSAKNGIDKELRQNKIFAAVEVGIKNLIEDAKSGDFYNKARSDAMYSELADMGDFDTGFSDDDFNFSDDDDDLSVKSSSSSSKSDSFESAIGAAAVSQATAVAQSTDVIVKSNSASTRAMMVKLDTMGATLSSNIGALYTSMNTTNEFLKGPLTTHLNNTKSYYENMTKMMQEQTAMMKEFVETQRTLYGNNKKYNSSSNKVNQSMNYDGSINLSGYLKTVKSNFDNSMFGMITGMADSIGDLGGENSNPYTIITSNLARTVFSAIVEEFIPKGFRKSLKSFDRGLSSLFSQAIARLNYDGKKSSNELVQMISEIFGVRAKKKDNIDTSNYNKGAVPFDGITRKSIIEVIPGYLARIEAALTGKTKYEENYFDFENGRWKTYGKTEKEFEREKRRSSIDANSSLLSELRPLINDVSKRNPKQGKKLEKSIYQMFDIIYDDGGFFNPRIDIATGKSSGDAWKYYKFDDKDVFDSVLGSLSKQEIRKIAINNMNARQSHSDRMKKYEENGSVYNILFNNDNQDLAKLENLEGLIRSEGDPRKKRKYRLEANSLRNKIKIESSRNEEELGITTTNSKAKGTGLLGLSTDGNGNNIFWYLQQIIQKIDTNHRSNANKYMDNNGRENKNTNISISSNTSTSESGSEDDSSGLGDDDDDDSDLEIYRAIIEEAEEKKRIEYEETHKNKTLREKVKEKLENSKAGEFINNIRDGAVDKVSNLFVSPVEYASKLFEKADNSMFKLIFGDHDYKDDDGNEIESVFEYIIYKIKKSFKQLSDWIKDKLFNPIKERFLKWADEKVKPVWDKYGKPVIEETKSGLKSGWTRVKEASSNTFGKAYEKIGETVKNGGVVDAEDVAQAQKEAKEESTDNSGIVNSAFGRVVKKRGLTMISPGEVIIPRSFDEKEQNEDLTKEKEEKSKILDVLGDDSLSDNIDFNAKGTINKTNIKDTIDEIINTGKKSYAKIGAGALLGGGVGLFAGSPLIGALAGSILSFITESDKAKNLLFGKDNNGEREGGMIPKKVLDIYKKYGSDMLDFGIAGGIVGLISPLGIVGSAAVGAGIGFLRNSDTFKKLMFGDAETGKDGIFTRESYNKFTEKLKKNGSKMLGGAAISTILGGPFGLIGNAIIGAGAGLLSTTNFFTDLMFGDGSETNKGIVGAFKTGVIDPFKDFAVDIINDLKTFTKEKMFAPFEKFARAITQDIKNIMTDIGDKVKEKVDAFFENYIGLPLRDFLQEKVFKPVSGFLIKVLKLPYNLAKTVISAPFKMLGGIADARRYSQIRRGKAYDMSAAERVGFRNDVVNKNVFTKGVFRALGRDEMAEQDMMIADMSDEDLIALQSAAESGYTDKKALEKRTAKAGSAVKNEVSAFFNTKYKDGTRRYDKVKFDDAKKIAIAAENSDIDKLTELLNKTKLTDDEKSTFLGNISDKIQNLKDEQTILDAANKSTDERDEVASRLLGRKFSGNKDMRAIKRTAEAELKIRRKNRKTMQEESPEEHATNNLTEIVQKTNSDIVTAIEKSNEYLRLLVIKDPDSIKDLEGENSNIKESIEKIRKSFNPKKESALTKEDEEENEDSIESVEERNKSELFRKTEEEETEAAKESSSVLTKIYEKLFGKKDKDDDDSNDGGFLSKLISGGSGILGKLGSAFGKFLHFLGVGGKVALAIGGVSIFGHMSEWFKTSVVPYLFGKENADGSIEGGLLPGVRTAILGNKQTGEKGLVGWLEEKFTEVKVWFENGGAVSYITEGISFAAKNFVAPITEGIINALPDLIIGIGKGVLNGIVDFFTDRDKNKTAGDGIVDETEAVVNEKGEVEYIPTGNKITTYGNTDINYSEPDILGTRYRTNENFMDENGNPIGEFARFNKEQSRLDRLRNAANRSFLNGVAGLSSPKIFEKLAKINPNGFKKIPKGIHGVIWGGTKTGAKSIAKISGNAIYQPNKVGNSINSMIKDILGIDAADDVAENVAKNAADDVAENAAENIVDGASKNKSWLSKVKDKIFGKKTVSEAAESATEAATDAAAKGASKSTSLLGKLTNKVSGLLKNTKIGKTVGGTASRVKENLVNSLRSVFEKIGQSPIGKKILNFIGGKAMSEQLELALRKIADSLADKGFKLLGKGATKLIDAATKVTPFGVALMIGDFIKGMDEAETILGVAKGDTEYTVTIGQKVLCGLLNVITSNLLFGLIPTDVVVDILIEYIFPLFGLDTTSINKARENADDILAQWNREHPDEQYDNIEDFNNKDKWTTKLKNAIKDGWTSLFGSGREDSGSSTTSSGSGKETYVSRELSKREKLYGKGHNYQRNRAIANIPYGDSTIGQSGCAPVAASNVINRMTNSGYSSIADAASYAESHNMTVPGGGTDINYFNSYFNSKGIPNYSTSNKNEVMSAINNGDQVVMLGKDSNNNNGSPFGTNPHFITAVGTDRSGNIIAEDPDSPDATSVFNKNKVLNSMIKSVVAGSSRKHGKGRNNPIRNHYRRLAGRGKGLGPEAIINIACSQVGIQAMPSNQVKYNDAYYGYHINATGYGWCCAFVWWVFNQAGAYKLLPYNPKTAYCPYLMQWFTTNGQMVSDPQPGDIAFMNFDGGTTAKHVGIVIGVDGDYVNTVEGNTLVDGNPNYCVAYKKRKYKNGVIVGFARPNYPYDYDDSQIVDMTTYGDYTNYKALAFGKSGSIADLTKSDNGNTTDASPNVKNIPIDRTLKDGIVKYNSTTPDGSTSYVNTGVTYTEKAIKGVASTKTNETPQWSSSSLLDKFKETGITIMKALFGEEAYNALFGEEETSSDEETGGDAQETEESKKEQQASLTAQEDINDINGDKLSDKDMEALFAKYGNKSTSAKSGTTTVSSNESNKAQPTVKTNSSSSLVGSTNAEKIWNYLSSKGVYTKAGIAGLMGNLEQESGYIPNNVENIFESRYGNDKEYTNRVDTGVYTKDDFVKNHKFGYGLPGWTYHTLKEGLYDATVGQNKSLGDLGAQIEYLHSNIKTQYPGLYKTLTTTDNYTTAADAMLEQYERPYGFSLKENAANHYDWSLNPDHVSARDREYNTRRTNAQRVYSYYAGEGRNNKNMASEALRKEGVGTTYGSFATNTLNTDGAVEVKEVHYNNNTSIVDYSTFLSTIVDVLLSIAGNTAMLSNILTILSDNFNIDLNTSDVQSAASQSKEKAKSALNRLVDRSSGNNTNISSLLNNKDTNYILSAMTELARE